MAVVALQDLRGEVRPRQLLTTAFQRLTEGDLDGFVGLFADDATLVDPAFETHSMQGRELIRAALSDDVGLGFRDFVMDRWLDGDDATSVAAEVRVGHLGVGDVNHMVFLLKSRDGMITRLAAYGPHPPGGRAALRLRLWRWTRRVQRKYE